MPAAFTATERDRITRLLRASGLRLFASQGLRKTALDELVRPAGIAKSTFYLFFDSKEALYLDLMLHRSEQVKRRVIGEALHTGVDTRDCLRRFLLATVDVLNGDPLYRRLMTHPDEMEAVAARLTPDSFAGMRDSDPVAAVAEFISQRQPKDRCGHRPHVLLGALQAVLILPAHAERLGSDLFPKVLDLVIDLVATGLTTDGPISKENES